MFHGGLAVFYAYSNTGDKHIHKWLREPENKGINTFLFMMCSLGYGLAMYIMVVRQWIVSIQLPTILGTGAQVKKVSDIDDLETKVKKSLKCQKYFFLAMHIILCGGMVYLAFYCSWRRKQAVSFYFTITFTLGWFVLDTVWRNTKTCWRHPELKMDYYFCYLQVFCLWTCAALIWASIQYAKVLQDSIDHKVALLNIMKAESNFYNVISAVELKGFFLDTFVAASIVYTQYKYSQVCEEDIPSLVTRQIEQVLLRDGTEEHLEEIRTKYYTCFDELGYRNIRLTEALSFFFLRRPRCKKSQEKLEADNNLLQERAKTFSIRYTYLSDSSKLSDNNFKVSDLSTSADGQTPYLNFSEEF